MDIILCTSPFTNVFIYCSAVCDFYVGLIDYLFYFTVLYLCMCIQFIIACTTSLGYAQFHLGGGLCRLMISFLIPFLF